MCVAEPHDFLVWKPHFLKVKLPREAVRGEHLLIRTDFYNYGDITLRVEFVILGVEGICSDAAPKKYSRKKRYTIKKEDSVSMDWLIVPLKTGTFEIQVMARHNKEVLDVVSKPLTVVSEGVPSGNTKTFVLEPMPTTSTHSIPPRCTRVNGKVRCTSEIVLPSNVVPGSATGLVSVTGNVFGPAADILLNGLGGQFRMPRGCGEQTMIYLTPGIYAYRYMQETDTSDGKYEIAFQNNIREGGKQVQRFYNKKNGGIAVWTGYKPSTWLTSLYLKAFSQAKKLGGVVDPVYLSGMVNFLYTQQNQDGADKGKFRMNYKVHHQEMIGLVKESDLTLTAFTMIALMEHNINIGKTLYPEKLAVSLDKLTQSVKDVGSSYEAALVAYALSLSDSPYKIIAYRLLKARAVQKIHEDSRIRYFPGPSRKIQIETAGYAILAALKHGDFDYCYDIVIWLHTQKRQKGLFETTSDTMIALQALAEYAAATKVASTDLTVTIKDFVNENIPIEVDNIENPFKITDQDSNREFLVPLPENLVSSGHTVVIEATGAGVAQANVEISYNIRGRDECEINLKVRTEVDDNVAGEEGNNIGHIGGVQLADADDDGGPKRTLTLEICVISLGEQNTEMGMIEIGLLTGFEPDELSLKADKDRKLIDEYEINDKMVAVYLPYISNSKETCIILRTKQIERVYNRAPAPIKVYDYYNPDVGCTKHYSDEEDTELHFDLEGQKCFEGTCGKCYGYGERSTQAYDFENFKEIVCAPIVNYVLRVDFIDSEEDGQFIYYYVRVSRVLKTGSIDYTRGMEIRMVKSQRCGCPDIDGMVADGITSYLVVGRVEEKVQTGDGHFTYQIQLDMDTYVEEWDNSPRGVHKRLRQYLRNPCRV